ncbi:MAG TPA: tripartite tricarboxylate transporter substrate-binding protein, partial [Aminivibrio sp.]|nr:tripartite tricarboxylate transporter substrate-binding protein [Aminivibrio sp.]
MVLAGLFAGAAFAAYPTRPFECIAPAGPGGGWDTTMRMTTKVLTEQKFVTVPMPVINKPGGGGGVALSYLQKKKGKDDTLVVYSPPLLLINLTGSTPLSYKNVTPISMLINDFGAYAVPKNSKYKNIKEVMEAIKKDPKSVKVGGMSAMGSMDHIQFLVAAKAAGVKDLKAIQYIAFQELKRTVSDNKAQSGFVIITNPSTGEILALASYPSFDPNRGSYRHLEGHTNMAVTHAFEPGSVIKPLWVAWGLEKKAFNMSQSVFCENGSYTFHRVTIHDHEKYGWLPVSDIIKYSSNIGIAKLMDPIRSSDMYTCLQAFGMLEPTGISMPKAW